MDARPPCHVPGGLWLCLACTAALVLLAGCANSERPASPADLPPSSYGNATPTTPTTTHNGTDVTFLEQAIPLRRQTVTLANAALHNSPSTPLKALARQIAQAEEPSASEMTDTLARWGRSSAAGTAQPAGLLTPAELIHLSGTTGPEFDQAWLRDIGVNLTTSQRATDAEQVGGADPPTRIIALDWGTELRAEQKTASELTTTS